MAIPSFWHFMVPLLHLTKDGAEYSLAEARDNLAASFNLTLSDREELLPSGTNTRFDNRVNWARTHLVKACLLAVPRRGRFCITSRGHDVLAEGPTQIKPDDLLRFAEYRKFRNLEAIPPERPSEPVDAAHDSTPQERLGDAYSLLRQQLADDLLGKIANAPPVFFERLVVKLIVAMGYGGSLRDAGAAVGRSGDGGIDGIIKEDKLGLDAVYIQAKRWAAPVGRPEVQTFAGSLEGVRARKGILITTSQFTQTAREYVRNIEKKIVLIDGAELAQHMIDYGIGVTPVETYTVSRVDNDFFEGE